MKKLNSVYLQKDYLAATQVEMRNYYKKYHRN